MFTAIFYELKHGCENVTKPNIVKKILERDQNSVNNIRISNQTELNNHGFGIREARCHLLTNYRMVFSRYNRTIKELVKHVKTKNERNAFCHFNDLSYVSSTRSAS